MAKDYISKNALSYFWNKIKAYIESGSNPYPVGSIYLSVNSTNPSTLFGGSWEQIKDRFLLGAGDTYKSGDTGGEATHKLTVAEMPSHTHTQNPHNHTVTTLYGISGGETYQGIEYAYHGTKYNNPTVNSNNATATNQNTGGNGAHNNMPPYLVVYVWKRVE